MKLLENKIRNEGRIIDGRIIKVDGFLNHRLDVAFIDKIAGELYERFKNDRIDKILTIESSGIAIAVLAARYFGVPWSFQRNINPRTYRTTFITRR